MVLDSTCGVTGVAYADLRSQERSAAMPRRPCCRRPSVYCDPLLTIPIGSLAKLYTHSFMRIHSFVPVAAFFCTGSRCPYGGYMSNNASLSHVARRSACAMNLPLTFTFLAFGKRRTFHYYGASATRPSVPVGAHHGRGADGAKKSFSLGRVE